MPDLSNWGAHVIKENKQLYIDCLKFWGSHEQLRQCQEECAELICAISHFIRADKKSTASTINKRLVKAKKDLIEECADALLMVEQIMTIIGEEEVLEIATKKAKQVSAKLEKYKAEIKSWSNYEGELRHKEENDNSIWCTNTKVINGEACCDALGVEDTCNLDEPCPKGK